MKLTEMIRKLGAEAGIIRRSAAIAVENIKQHVGNLKPKFDESKAWADAILQDQASLLDNWKPKLERLSAIPAFEELQVCLRGAYVPLSRNESIEGPSPPTTLLDFVDPVELKKAGELGANISKKFGASVANLHATFGTVLDDSHEVVENFSQGISLSDSDAGEQAGRLMEEVEVLGKKISGDLEYISGLPNNQKTISQVSRTALLHTRNFLPSMVQIRSEIDQLWHDSAQRKSQAMQSAVQQLQRISVLESTVAQIHARLANLDAEVENAAPFDLLNSSIRLPSVYGALLVECVRRREWNEKMTLDSSSLVEELATFKEEELRRRKRWLRDMGGVVDLGLIDDMALGVDVTIKSQKQKWPNITREHIASFLGILKATGTFDDVYGELEELAKALDLPTRQQVRRAKAFKNGSVHDGSFGKTSFLLRGDDDLLQSLKIEKSKLEDRLKSSESRIRKLEDLLHRQSQISRPTSGAPFGVNLGPSFERHIMSPLPNYTSSLSRPHEIPSRGSSISSRKNIVTNDTDEQNMAQRIMALEAELGAEKAQSAVLQKNLVAKEIAEEELRNQVQEAISVRDNLLENLKTQQQEFDDQRRGLEKQNVKIKTKLEGLEDELGRVLEVNAVEDKVRALEGELLGLRQEATRHNDEAQAQISSLRTDYERQLTNAENMEAQLEERKIQNAELDSKLKELTLQIKRHDQSRSEHYRGLRATLLQLSKDEAAPNDFNSLVELVEVTAENIATHLNQIRETLSTVQADNLGLEARARERADEIYDLTERLGAKEIEVLGARENLAEQKTQFSALVAELKLEREQHGEAQARLSAVEAISTTLENRLDKRDREFDSLSSELLDSREQLQTRGSELLNRQARLDELQQDHGKLRTHIEALVPRADEVSMRLYSHKEVLLGLLEQIGLTAIMQDDKMVIQKAPKTAGASTVLNDASMSMHRSISIPLATMGTLETPIDGSVARWAHSDNADDETSRFTEYMEEIHSFDLDAFNEAVVKRFKDIEHVARKWGREARACRDKFHRAQNEAHEKIAFRSFKEGDLALFLPTRNQATRPWAAFNVGAPHFFLREQDSHKLRTRDWLLARISKVEERVVNLAKSLDGGDATHDRRSIGEGSDGGTSFDDENPFELSDGLRWYLLDAAEEKLGAPINIGLSKVTVASANVDAKGSIRMKKSPDGSGATKTLTRSLDSRRNSTNSRKGTAALAGSPLSGAGAVAIGAAAGVGAGEVAVDLNRSNPDIQRPLSPVEVNPWASPPGGEANDEVRKHLLWGP